MMRYCNNNHFIIRFTYDNIKGKSFKYKPFDSIRTCDFRQTGEQEQYPAQEDQALH